MKVLVLAAHMDDEVLGCGGTIARHVAMGDDVAVMWFTDGVSSRGHADAEQEAVLRHQESLEAAHILGITSIYRRQFDDQLMDMVPLKEIASHIAHVFDAERPDVVYTHWLHDLNQDHQQVAKASLIASRLWSNLAPTCMLAYEVPESTGQAFMHQPFAPNVFVDITQHRDKKLDALGCYRSERRFPPHPRSETMVARHAASRGADAGVKAAEAFVLVRQVLK